MNENEIEEPEELDKDAVLEELNLSIQTALQQLEDLSENEILTGWVICWESTTLNDNDRKAGQVYGPSEMTTWRAMGLIEWVRRFCLSPDEEEE